MPGSEVEAPSAEFDQLVAELAAFLISVPDEAWIDREEDAYTRYGRAGSSMATLQSIRNQQYGGAR